MDKCVRREHWWNATGRRRKKFLQTNLSLCQFDPTYLTRTDLGLSPCLVVERQATDHRSSSTTDRMSHDTVQRAPTPDWMVPSELLMTVGAFSWCEGTDFLNFKWYESQLASGLGVKVQKNCLRKASLVYTQLH
jgi:hypothetical protein